MKLIDQSVEVLDWGCSSGIDILKKIEKIGRVCYKSENKITNESCYNFIAGLIKSGHHSVIEHHNITVKFITNRGVTHELVRHRLASYSQESTRYVKYNGDMEIIKPVWWSFSDEAQKDWFIKSCEASEDYYLFLIGEESLFEPKKENWKPQHAREVLPNALKTEIVVTANLREWRHIFNLRCSKAAHPQIRELMKDTLILFCTFVPIVFQDLYDKYVIDSKLTKGKYNE